jgi:hypothetical protein
MTLQLDAQVAAVVYRANGARAADISDVTAAQQALKGVSAAIY